MQIVFTTYSSFRTVCNSKCYVPNLETSKLLRMLKCQCYIQWLKEKGQKDKQWSLRRQLKIAQQESHKIKTGKVEG
jgi:ribosomal protein S8